ncbi:hypothetical protein ES708_13999 [subsurface metagenome]
MKNNTAKERLQSIISEKPSSWQDHLDWVNKNKAWLDKSAKIALKILRTLREHSISQKELADKLGVSPQYINKAVKGNENLSLETITKIEGVLGISLISISSYGEGQSIPEQLLRNCSWVLKSMAKPISSQKSEYHNQSTYEPDNEEIAA